MMQKESEQPAAELFKSTQGENCHLDAEMIKDASAKLVPEDNSILFIENVGNLVCSGSFRPWRELCKVVVLFRH